MAKATFSSGAGQEKSQRGPVLMQTVEAAGYLNISPRTLEDCRIGGGGPVFHRVAIGKRGVIMYALADLNAWLAERPKQTLE